MISRHGYSCLCGTILYDYSDLGAIGVTLSRIFTLWTTWYCWEVFQVAERFQVQQRDEDKNKMKYNTQLRDLWVEAGALDLLQKCEELKIQKGEKKHSEMWKPKNELWNPWQCHLQQKKKEETKKGIVEQEKELKSRKERWLKRRWKITRKGRNSKRNNPEEQKKQRNWRNRLKLGK